MKSDLLLVGQTPPPFHGQAVVTQMLFEYNWMGEANLKVDKLRMQYSVSIEDVGGFTFRKVFHLFELILKSWWMVLTKRPKVLYYPPASANLVPVLRDIIYLLCVRWCFKKCVFHYHAGGLSEYIVQAGLVGKLAKFAYGYADASVELFEAKGIALSPSEEFKAKKGFVVPNGLEVKKMVRGRSCKRFRILFVGALNAGKGVTHCIETVKTLVDEGHDVEIQFVGAWASADYQQEVESKIEELSLAEQVLFSGVLKGDDKWQSYADADCFLFPSSYQSENFPLVIVEAMGLGLPVVTTKWRGIPKLVGEAGLLCDINAPAQYSEAISELMAKDEYRAEIGELAKSRYEKFFSQASFIDSIEKIFKQIV